MKSFRNCILSISLVLVASLGLSTTIGCDAQATAASLASILGTAGSSLSLLEGNATVAAKITTDTNLAVSAIQNWKSGTPAQNIVEALNLVEADISVLPVTPQVQALIELALGTAEEIITLVNGNTPQPITSASVQTRAIGRHTVAPNTSIKNAKEFRRQWNAIVAQNPMLIPVALK